MLYSIGMETTPFNLPPVGRYTSRKKWEEGCWKKIVASREILPLLITSYERRNLVLRAAAVDRINAGERHGRIAKELWLSPQTISNIKKAISGDSYKSYRERGKSERRKRVYSSIAAAPKRRVPHGRPVRTKYGIVYLR